MHRPRSPYGTVPEDVIERRLAGLAAKLAPEDRALQEDLTQEGRIAAWQAAKDWREDGGMPALGYLLAHARQNMLTTLGRERRQAARVYYLDEVPELADPRTPEQTLTHRRALERLARCDHGIRAACYGPTLGFHDAEIAALLGVSDRRVRELRAEGRQALAA